MFLLSSGSRQSGGLSVPAPRGAGWAAHRDVGPAQESERGARYTWSRYEASRLAKYLQPFDSVILVLGSYPKHVQFRKGTCIQRCEPRGYLECGGLEGPGYPSLGDWIDVSQVKAFNFLT